MTGWEEGKIEEKEDGGTEDNEMEGMVKTRRKKKEKKKEH